MDRHRARHGASAERQAPSVYQALRSVEWSTKARERFFPRFGSNPPAAALDFIEGLDPFDPLDVGVLVGLNAWLRDALRGEPALYETAFAPTGIDDIRHESPVVIVIVVPVAIKVGGGVAVGVTTVFKSVEKYFTVKEKRAKEKRARAQEKQAQAEEELARARAEEARANAERARAEAARTREQTRREIARLGLQPAITDDLRSHFPEVSFRDIERATNIAANLSAVVIAELDGNPAVAAVGIERD